MGLIGENGAGKSTTINCILNETQKTSGQILIFGKDHISDEIEIKDKLGVVFDENHLYLLCDKLFMSSIDKNLLCFCLVARPASF